MHPTHQTEHSALETPTPRFWTNNGYIIIRADEIRVSQSPGVLHPYSESLQHGGILSNKFYSIWYSRQVAPDQYGLPGRTARNWGPDTVEGDLSSEELNRNRYEALLHEQRYRDDKRKFYHPSILISRM